MKNPRGAFRPWSWAVVAVLVMLVSGPDATASVKELRNDSFSGIGSVTCQIGFVEGESAAAKLTADPGDYPYRVEKVRMLICPALSSGFVILRLYEDNSGTVVPGPLLYEEIVQVIGSDDALNEVDLSSNGIIVESGSVRVALEWFQNPPPGLAHDLDGFLPNVNFIFANPPGAWYYANQLGVTGDWIIRMEIETNVGGLIFADDFESGTTGGWSSTNP